MSSAVQFIAVQCCQCSTMQVKQKKKSSNKWTCVVCNQKQSLRKIYAQGFMAKDLRKFVQSFNLSRGKLAPDDGGQLETLVSVASSADATTFDDQEDHRRRRRRSDWSDYLDIEENVKQEVEHGDDDFGPKIVTELTKEMLKKPKLKNSGYGFGNGDDADSSTSQSVFSRGKERRKDDSAKVSKWTDYMTEQEQCKEVRKNEPKMATKATKWDAYITHGDNGLNVTSGRNFTDDSHDVWETTLDDEKVEDDIHPDFM